MNSKSFFVVFVLLFIFFRSHSQDTIRLKNGLMLHGLITEVNGKEIKFRVDGGSVTLDQVISYQKNGNTISVQTQQPKVENNKPTTTPDCEKKNVGDAEFVNKTENDVTVFIYAIAIPPDEAAANSSKNPLVAQIDIPAKSSKTAFELSHGVHYIQYMFGVNLHAVTQPRNGTGQVKISRCETTKYELK